jgi:hypothetical protein
LFSTACLAVATITGKVHLQILSTLNLHRFGGNGVEKRGKLHSKEDLSFHSPSRYHLSTTTIIITLILMLTLPLGKDVLLMAF